MGLLRKISVTVAIGVGMAWTVLMAFVVSAGFQFGEIPGHRLHRWWGKGVLWLLGIHVVVSGLENLPQNRSVILAPNHQSFIDICVLAALPLDFKWISKREVGRIPFVGWAMRRIGCYFVNRDRTGRDLNTLKVVEDGLRSGKSVAIFPEGTRTRTGELLPLKKGAFRTAQNSGVPLLPVGISGTYSLARPGHMPDRRGHRVTVRIGRPFPVGPGDLMQPMEDYSKVLAALLQEGRAT